MRIRQIVLAAQGLADGRDALARLLGLPAPFRDPGVAEFGIDNAVFCFGDQFIEVISPTRPGTACGRHLQRQGDSAYMLILQTDDLARDQARCAALGVRSVWQASFADISAMHLHPKDLGAAIVSLDQPIPPASWRWGGPGWQVQPGADGRQRVRGIRLLSPQAPALAARWAQVLGLAAPQPLDAPAEGWRLALDDGHIDVLPSADGREGVAGFTLAVADLPAVLARARAAGLAVQGSSVQALGADWQLEALAAAVA